MPQLFPFSFVCVFFPEIYLVPPACLPVSARSALALLTASGSVSPQQSQALSCSQVAAGPCRVSQQTRAHASEVSAVRQCMRVHRGACVRACGLRERVSSESRTRTGPEPAASRVFQACPCGCRARTILCARRVKRTAVFPATREGDIGSRIRGTTSAPSRPAELQAAICLAWGPRAAGVGCVSSGAQRAGRMHYQAAHFKFGMALR